MMGSQRERGQIALALTPHKQTSLGRHQLPSNPAGDAKPEKFAVFCRFWLSRALRCCPFLLPLTLAAPESLLAGDQDSTSHGGMAAHEKSDLVAQPRRNDPCIQLSGVLRTLRALPAASGSGQQRPKAGPSTRVSHFFTGPARPLSNV